MADGDDEGFAGFGRIPVSELGGVLHLNRDASKALDHVFAHHTRMPSRATGHEDDPVQITKRFFVTLEATELGGGSIIPKTAPQGVLQSGRLLENLLFHVGIEIPQFDLLENLVQRMGHGLSVLALEGGNPEFSLVQNGNLPVVEKDSLLGPSHEGGSVAGNEIRLIAQPDYERRSTTGSDHHLRIIDAENGNAVGSPALGKSQPNGIDEAILILRKLGVMIGDQVAEDLGIGLGGEGDSLGGEKALEGAEVLDDPVVDQDELTVLAQMRMGIGNGNRTVGRPTGMGDAKRRRGTGFPEGIGQVLHPTRFPGKGELIPFVKGNPRGIIAPVFKTAQAIHERLLGGALA